MSRIFNLDFLFLNQNHKALISVNSNANEPYVHVELLDSIFKKILPTGHIRYKGYQGYKKLSIYNDPFIRKIIDTIASEIEREICGNYAKVKSLLEY